MEKKYRLTEAIKTTLDGRTLHRIEALRNIENQGEILVHRGDIGGFVESESNLSHDGTCWIYDYSEARGNAKIMHDAKISGCSKVVGHAMVEHNAVINNRSIIAGVAIVRQHAFIYHSNIYGGSNIIEGFVNIINTKIYGDRINIYGRVRTKSGVTIEGNDIKIGGDFVLHENTTINDHKDFIVMKNFWSSGRDIVYTISDKMWHAGCFHGTSKQLIEQAYIKSKLCGDEYKRLVNYVNRALKNININKQNSLNHGTKETGKRDVSS